ncbi:hypothetical protein PHMEG_00011995 [Phytophthora megakarya]|uniref:Uncharacterized protein n=1 Tax=Phytophthora megakarya TaxID=4795 RepID=A0A225WAC3_9STRA|nr:hypothetical protein PHMEG_00011995 [Phytophthora megakarya]
MKALLVENASLRRANSVLSASGIGWELLGLDPDHSGILRLLPLISASEASGVKWIPENCSQEVTGSRGVTDIPGSTVITADLVLRRYDGLKSTDLGQFDQSGWT